MNSSITELPHHAYMLILWHPAHHLIKTQ